MLIPTASLCAIAAALATLPLAFDKVMLHDGRVIPGKILESPDEEVVLLRLPGADVPIRKELVDRVYVEDLEDYVPKNDEEREHLAKGWVLFEGRWMSRTKRESELRKRAEADEAAIEKLRAEQDWRNAKEFESLHFAIKSNARQEVVDDYVARLEQYYKEFMDTWRIRVAPSLKRKKQQFFLYRNADDFYKYTRKRRGVLGFFNWVDGELHLFHDDQDYDFAISVLYHEGNHLLTYLIDPQYRYPNWMNEGMAEYFGSASVDEDGDFHVGALQYSRIASLRNDEARDRSIGIRELLLTEPGGFTGRHYAVAWSFTHFLMTSPRYGKAYKTFFAKLPKNRKVDVENISGMMDGKSVVLSLPDLASLTVALEKALGRSIEELEEEWRDFVAQEYGDLTANAYHYAARITLFSEEPDADSVRMAMDYYDKSVGLGVTKPTVYRQYAELLRKGGLDDYGVRVRVQKADPARALHMIERAIDLDPVNPLNYCEAAGILVLDSPVQDLDRAQSMISTARALAFRDPRTYALLDELEAIVERGQEMLAMRAERDTRLWTVLPFYESGQEEPERIEGLSTEDVLVRIAKGEVGGDDWVFETTQHVDAETGETGPGSDPWDTDWVPVKDVPFFADAL